MTHPTLDYASTADEVLTRRTVSKVLWRLIPLMCFLYLFNYLDRVNVSFAKLQMSTDLKFNDAIYGLGASIFFIGYFIFEVPSNLIMEKVGARLWMARIMVTWGLISVAMMFVKEPWHFYGLRLLLGIAEAGFFPGMILYMTYWIPAEQRARAAALFLTSTALSGVVGGPLADVLMQIDHFGLRGWQWLFLLEGIPSVILGFGILFFLTDRPEQARWLSADEKRVLLNRLATDHAAMGHTKHSLMHAVGDPRVWILCLLYGTVIFGFYVINYWTPSLIKITLAPGSTAPIGALSAIPFFAAAVTMSVAGWWADHTGKRTLTIVLFALGGACGYAIAAMAHTPITMIVGLSIAAAGIWSTLGPIWALPSRFLTGTAAAAGIGMINSFGNLIGGFIGPNMMGQIKERYGNYDIGLWVSAAVSVLAAVVAGLLVKERHEPAVSVPSHPIPPLTDPRP
ncbi:MFS transporter [Humisphaera borealis]|uniref:MFS transporter n=1 Tax=Humisphaera borealis TaxID=2807512 RepID=A0A7M2X288_9BACT|nr:MFS transporter [Humisphaera borealis]QOV91858.1 MFS transporter [Humisphaera borealis]